jgi:hypothetical protein
MSSGANGENRPYDVRMSGQTGSALKQLHQEAIEVGVGQSFLAALRQIIAGLQNDPPAFGEPLYRLPALHLLVRQGSLLPLVVNYAVHEERRLVFIRGFKSLS